VVEKKGSSAEFVGEKWEAGVCVVAGNGPLSGDRSVRRVVQIVSVADAAAVDTRGRAADAIGHLPGAIARQSTGKPIGADNLQLHRLANLKVVLVRVGSAGGGERQKRVVTIARDAGR